MCNATRDIMDCMFEAVLEASQDPDDIPQTTEPLWLLGKKYNTINGTSKLISAICCLSGKVFQI